MLKLFLVVFIVIAISFGLIAIKMFLKKGGSFEKKCSSVNPKTGEKFGCTCGNNDNSEECENK